MLDMGMDHLLTQTLKHGQPWSIKEGRDVLLFLGVAGLLLMVGAVAVLKAAVVCLCRKSGKVKRQ